MIQAEENFSETRLKVETGLEVLDPLFLDHDSVAIKVELPESSQTDMGFGGTEFFAYFVEDVTPERMFSDAIIPATEFARPDPKTVSFKGKNVVDKTEVTSGGSNCLVSFAEDTSQENMLSDTVASASKTSRGPEEIWNIGLDAGESSWSSCHNVWDTLAQDAIELEIGAGPGAPIHGILICKYWTKIWSLTSAWAVTSLTRNLKIKLDEQLTKITKKRWNHRIHVH